MSRRLRPPSWSPMSVRAVAALLLASAALAAGCGGPDQADVDRAISQAVSVEAEQGAAALDRAVTAEQAAGSKAAAEYAALAVDLFVTLSSTNVGLEAPGSFAGGLPAAASQLRDSTAAARDILDRIARVSLDGNRLEQQRSALVEGTRGCLRLIESAAADLDAGSSSSAAEAALPITECWVAARDRFVRLGVQ